MTTRTQTVRLTKLFLWVEAARFEVYPELVSRLDPDRVYRAMREVAQVALGSRMADSKNMTRDDLTFNLPGWGPPRQGDPVLKGIGLLENRNGGYALSAEGSCLGTLYREKPRENAWKVELARILLSREPRTRVLIRLLAEDGASLRFSQPEWFGGSYREAALESGASVYHPFPGKKGPGGDMQSLLNHFGRWALGAWASDDPVRDADSVVFAGTGGPSVSTNDLGMALRGPLELFLNLHLVRESEGIVSWDHRRASELLPSDLVRDLGGPVIETSSVEHLAVRLIDELAADDGFVVASELRDALQSNGIEAPDKQLADLMARGVIRLEAYDYGQARHGKGLFDDPRKQLVKFRVNNGNSNK
jgi:hypothetical protein